MSPPELPAWADRNPARPHAHVHGGGAVHATARLRIALIVVAALFLAEVVIGTRARSLALLSDAGHLATDTGSLGLAWYAVSRSRRPASAQHTFGHHRVGILVAATNGAALLVVALGLAVTAAGRLQHPVAVDALPVAAVGLVALVANCGVAAMLSHAGGGLSMRSAMLHVLADALASAGVVVSAVIIAATGWQGADPAVSLLIAGLIAVSAVGLLNNAFRILGEATPSDIDAGAVHALIAGTDGIDGVHDLHIWSLSSDHRALTAHVTIGDRPLTDVTVMLQELEIRLCAAFKIEHATLQPECPSCLDSAPLYCDLDERHELAHTAFSVMGVRPRR